MAELSKEIIALSNAPWFPTMMEKLEYVKVIRCKDCKHYWESAGMCTKAEFPINNSIEPNDYCSRAERKEQ